MLTMPSDIHPYLHLTYTHTLDLHRNIKTIPPPLIKGQVEKMLIPMRAVESSKENDFSLMLVMNVMRQVSLSVQNW